MIISFSCPLLCGLFYQDSSARRNFLLYKKNVIILVLAKFHRYDRIGCVAKHPVCRRSSSVEYKLPKLGRGVRFPSPAVKIDTENPDFSRFSVFFVFRIFGTIGTFSVRLYYIKVILSPKRELPVPTGALYREYRNKKSKIF